MNWVLVIVGLVAVERLAELVYAERNTRRLIEAGAVEVGRQHYPLLVGLHAAWLLTLATGVPATAPIYVLPLVLFVALQGVRFWVLRTLGPYWTTRIVTLPEAPVVRTGPYRWIRHPNYVVVVMEIALLPLVFGAANYALVFSALNLLILAWRIRVEDRALRPRRRIQP